MTKEEQILEELILEEMKCNNNYDKLAKFRTRMISKDELLKEFSEDAEEKLIRSPIFNATFQALMQGANKYVLIETLVDLIESQNVSMENLIKNYTNPFIKL